MKKLICLLLAACMLFVLAACQNQETAAQTTTAAPQTTTTTAPQTTTAAPQTTTAAPQTTTAAPQTTTAAPQTTTAAPQTTAAPAEEAEPWSIEGYFSDEDGNMVSITWMDDMVEPGWYVGVMIGETMAGWTLRQEGDSLHGDLNAGDEKAAPFIVTVTPEGEDGIQLAAEGGKTYHLTRMELQEATIFISVNTEGNGNIDYAEGDEAPEVDPEYPFQSAQINLAEPAVYTLIAWADAGNLFVKWTKNGEDFSTEPVINVVFDESADYIAVFEEDPDWQNPVMNFVGEYQCGDLHALVECLGYDEAWITVEQEISASKKAQWNLVGRFDPDTLTVEYTGCAKQIITVDDKGEATDMETEYEDGFGTVVFGDDGTFTWHEEEPGFETDLVFEWAPPAAE